MSGSLPAPPELLPMLSRGKHRNSRKGACFMEMASVLAGERWSDQPRCTHPLLAELARHVNDCTSDDHRQQLAVLIPSVVGLTSDDPRVDARIALRCAQAALPVASQERQNVMAVSILTADCVLAGLDGRLVGNLEEGSRQALESAPHAAEWAHDFVRRAGISVRGFRRHAAPSTVRGAVHAIAKACVPDPDAVLRRLLTDVIGDCTALCAARVPGRAGRGTARAGTSDAGAAERPRPLHRRHPEPLEISAVLGRSRSVASLAQSFAKNPEANLAKHDRHTRLQQSGRR